jgi:hypothetical protein
VEKLPNFQEPDPDKRVVVRFEDGAVMHRWPRDRRSPEKRARDNANFQAGMRKVKVSLAKWLEDRFGARVLFFRPKQSKS